MSKFWLYLGILLACSGIGTGLGIFLIILYVWGDIREAIDCNNIQKTIEDKWEKGGADSIAILMRGIVGQCIIEIRYKDEILLFASIASGGFYWILTAETYEIKHKYLVSNDEGRFFRQAFHAGGKITDKKLKKSHLYI